jgi:biofilm PGA synthesis lipoprotein PgaB
MKPLASLSASLSTRTLGNLLAAKVLTLALLLATTFAPTTASAKASYPRTGTATATTPRVTILCYHEVNPNGTALVPGYSITPELLREQLTWLRDTGWHFVSVDDVLADEAGVRPLPDKAVLLTFDDGYQSVYDHAYPLLKAFHAPALVALVGSWMEPESGEIEFDGRKIPRNRLLSWQELREMQASGLVEVASHSFALHQGITANPQGNLEPAAVARQWLPAKHAYENERAYVARVKADLKRNSALIAKHLGKPPRSIVWPYGRYNQQTLTVAAQLGMSVGFNLNDGPDTLATPPNELHRVLVQPTLGLAGLQREVELRNHNILDNGVPAKVMHVDLDYLYDADPVQQEDNLGRLLDRINWMGVNTVYLQAYADPDANGAADALYFPNRHLPMRADLFNRVAWQILTRTAASRVYAWMPLLAFELPAKDPAAKDRVMTQPNKANHLAMGYPRLSPFSPRARKAIREIYEDLGRAATFDGILFHDDVTLSDYEDASPWAMAEYRAWGLPTSLPELRQNDTLLREWAARKTAYLDAFAGEVAGLVRREQPGLKTARNLYATVALNPYAETWYSQSLQSSLAHYDYTAIMAMPYMEQAPDAQAFYQQLVEQVAKHPGAMKRVIIELQTVNWRNNDEPLPPNELADTVRMLYGMGVKNVGYYPDNLYRNNPDPAQLRPVFATKPNLQPLEELLSGSH